MAKKPTLTKELAQAAFYQAWFADIGMPEQDPETYQRAFAKYRKRLERLPMLALKTIARAASAEVNRSINAYEKLRPLPSNLRPRSRYHLTPGSWRRSSLNIKQDKNDFLTRLPETHVSLRPANTRPPKAGDDFRKFSIK